MISDPQLWWYSNTCGSCYLSGLFLAQALVPGGVPGVDKPSGLILFPDGIELASPDLVKKTMGAECLSLTYITGKGHSNA